MLLNRTLVVATPGAMSRGLCDNGSGTYYEKGTALPQWHGQFNPEHPDASWVITILDAKIIGMDQAPNIREINGLRVTDTTVISKDPCVVRVMIRKSDGLCANLETLNRALNEEVRERSHYDESQFVEDWFAQDLIFDHFERAHWWNRKIPVFRAGSRHWLGKSEGRHSWIYVGDFIEPAGKPIRW